MNAATAQTRVIFSLVFYGIEEVDTYTLEELGWKGQQGEELTEFIESEHREWTMNFIDCSYRILDEDGDDEQ